MTEEAIIPEASDVPNVDVFDDIPLDINLSGLSTSGSTVIDNMNKSHGAILRSHATGDSILEAYLEADAQSNIKSYVGEQAANKSVTDVEELKEAFLSDPSIGGGDITENLEIVKELTNLYNERSNDIPAQVVDAAAKGAGDINKRAEMEAQLTVLNSIQELNTDLSFLDIGQDILTAFVPGKLSFDNFSLTGEFWDADGFMRDLIIGYKSMSPEDKLKNWPSIKSELLDHLPKTRALATMSKFLDPIGEENLGEFHPAWAAVDVVDVAATGAFVGLRLASLTKKINAIRMLKKLDNADDAADVATTVILDGHVQAARKAGIDLDTAYANAAPFNVSDLDEAFAVGLSAKIVSRIKKFEAFSKQKASQLIDDELTIRESLLDVHDRPVAEAEFAVDLKAEGYENVTVVKQTPDSTFFSVDLHTGEGIVKKDIRMDLTLNEVGVWERAKPSILSDFLFSPSVIAKGQKKASSQAAIRLDNLAPKIGDQLRLMSQMALKPLIGDLGLGALRPSKRLQIAELDKVLLAGDMAGEGRGVVYTAEQLRTGVDGVPLNDNQIEAYYNLRYLFDELGYLRNVAERRSMVAKGIKSLDIFGVDKKIFGAVSPKAINASSVIKNKKVGSVWVQDKAASVEVERLDLPKLYEEGYRLVHLNDAQVMEKGSKSLFKTILVKANNISELPEQVMHFKKGYVPKINKDAYYFLKSTESASIDGVMREEGKLSTIRFFDNREEADEVLKAMQAESPDLKLKVFEDHELEKQIMGSSGMGSSGGLVTGARSSQKIGFGRDNLPTERLNSFEALSVNLNQLEKYIARNQWRMGMERKWANSAKAVGVDTRGKFETNLIPDSLESGIELKKFGEKIKSWSGFPTKGEIEWDMKARGVMEWALGKGFSREGATVKGLHYLSHSSPIASARAAAFHSLLGWFNPVQMWVQAQGASIALTLATRLDDPIGGVRAVKNQFALNHGTLLPREHLGTAAKAFGLKEDELVEMVDLWRKTGYQESILNTADHAASIGSHGIGAQAIKRVVEKGTFFYEAGELFNRRVSFLVALNEFKKSNKGIKVSNEALKGIMTRANDFMLNLSKANRAGFQEGLASMSTQFLQVNAKTIETLLGLNGSFSRGERAKIAFGQLGLYGMAGVPLVNMAARWISSALGVTQDEIEELDPELVKLATDGFWGWFALSAFEADIDIGRRGAVASGVENFIFGLLSADTSVSEALSGAFGEVPHRFFQGLRKTKPLMLGAYKAHDLTNPTPYLQSLSHLAKITSTWSNLEKARFMHFNNRVLVQSTGETLIKKDFSLGTEIAVGIGFQPGFTRKIFDLASAVRERREYRKQVSAAMISASWDYVREISNAESPEEKDKIIEKFNGMKNLMLQSLPDENDRDLVRKNVFDKITNPEDKATRVINSWLKDHAKGQTAMLAEIKSSALANGLIQLKTIKKDPTGEEE